MIIGVVGKAGSGKDTVADFLVEQFGFAKVSLADPLKRFCREVFDFSEEQLWGASEHRNSSDPRYPRADGSFLTPRFALQSLGTEWGRTCYDNVWADHCARTCRALLAGNCKYTQRHGLVAAPNSEPFPGVVVADVRFHNEVNALKGIGGRVWKVCRPVSGLPGAEGRHLSEMEMDGIDADVLVHNDGSLNVLFQRVRSILWEYRS